MIVLDEQLCREPLRNMLNRWYPGKIIYITDLRPFTHIEDPDVPLLLLSVKQPTFVTINYKDFWREIRAHRNYCVVCLSLKSQLPATKGLSKNNLTILV